MSPQPLRALSVLALVAASAAHAYSLPECATRLRVEARVAVSTPPPVVCVSPGQDTVWRLEAALLQGPEGLVVDGDSRGLPLYRSEAGFTVSLPDQFPSGGRYQLTLRFAGGEPPATLLLEVVVHPAQATQQVRVYREARSPEDLLREAQEARTEAQQCGQERARLQATCSVSTGLRGLLRARTPPDAVQFASLDLTRAATWGKDNALSLMAALTYRAGRYRALAVQLQNPGVVPWSAAGAQLALADGAVLPLLPLGQESSIAPGKKGWVVVELLEAEELPAGPLTLTLWEEQGQHAVRVGNLFFP
jgi:uncharacterized protein (TIGR02268 family)